MARILPSSVQRHFSYAKFLVLTHGIVDRFRLFQPEGAIMKNRLPLVVVCGIVVAALIVTTRWQPVRAEAEKSSAGRYTVIETHGHNLLVTDNQENKLLFYATDKDAPIGSPLKLRASMDLTQIGKPEIKITPHNLEKFEPRDKKE
jgi:hypothetical protein